MLATFNVLLTEKLQSNRSLGNKEMETVNIGGVSGFCSAGFIPRCGLMLVKEMVVNAVKAVSGCCQSLAASLNLRYPVMLHKPAVNT